MEWIDFKKMRQSKADERYAEKIEAKRKYYTDLQVITDEDRAPYMDKARAILAWKLKGGAA